MSLYTLCLNQTRTSGGHWEFSFFCNTPRIHGLPRLVLVLFEAWEWERQNENFFVCLGLDVNGPLRLEGGECKVKWLRCMKLSTIEQKSFDKFENVSNVPRKNGFAIRLSMLRLHEYPQSFSDSFRLHGPLYRKEYFEELDLWGIPTAVNKQNFQVAKSLSTATKLKIMISHTWCLRLPKVMVQRVQHVFERFEYSFSKSTSYCWVFQYLI